MTIGDAGNTFPPIERLMEDRLMKVRVRAMGTLIVTAILVVAAAQLVANVAAAGGWHSTGAGSLVMTHPTPDPHP